VKLTNVPTNYSCAGDIPTFIFYDQGCKLLSTVMAPGDALGVRYLYSGPNGALFIVDRFHFAHHSPLDTTCRTYCNPYNPDNTGMVVVHRRNPVPNAGNDPLLLNGIGKSIRRIEEVNGQNKTVHRRVMRREEPAGSGAWVEYECEDVGNTVGRWRCRLTISNSS
jgi:hypothetical protein